MCTEVCARGSVQVEPWLAHAIRQQSRLVQTLPLCWASLLGTHNSAITLADGYGNLDEYFRGEAGLSCCTSGCDAAVPVVERAPSSAGRAGAGS